ncbi:MAG: ATP synthase F1 subunit delta [Candidatus Eremiobacteraeota bacterium]|nr:ATP synthase F1 subunit delta [Candidatus Eremiobacteraeota bacterium]
MANETVARRYAVATYELAREAGAVDKIRSDLHAFRDAIYGDATTRSFFLSPVVDRKEKERLLEKAFGGKAHDVALHSLLLLVRKRRETLLAEIVGQFDVLEVRGRGAEPLTITTAVALSREELDAMVARLEKTYGKKFDVEQKIDAHLIGGMRIMMGDRRIDGSVAGRLDELTRALYSKN